MKRFLITGASRGIGRAIALKLAAPDVMLLLHGRDIGALAETCRAAERTGAKTAKLIHDLAIFRGIDDLVAEVGHEPIAAFDDRCHPLFGEANGDGPLAGLPELRPMSRDM